MVRHATKLVTKRSLSLAFAVSALVIVGAAAAVSTVMSSHSAPSPVASSSTASAGIAPPQCSAPCAVWTKAGGSDPESVAISPNDSFVVVGVGTTNGSEIYALDDEGNTLWSHSMDHQISSVAVSSNGKYIAAGGFQIKGGPISAATYTNGEVYLFGSGGELLWSVSTGSTNPVFKVAISTDGSKLSVDGEGSITYLSGSDGSTIWSYQTGGNAVGMAMSPDGSLIVASMGKIVAFNGQGAILWSHPGQALAVSVNSVAISTDGSHVWAGSAESGYNGSLYLFNRQGGLLWQHQIFSPALSIQPGANTTAFVSTNFGALLYEGDGALLKNLTSSAVAPIAGGCNPLPSFWYWGTNEEPVAFIDAQGSVVSSYNPGGFTVNAALSSDGSYAAVVSQNGLSKSFSLALVYLGAPNQGCASVANGTYAVTFRQTGACSPVFWGVPWSVSVGNLTQVQPPGTKLPLDNYSLSGTRNSSLSEITFSLATGTYGYRVSPSAGFFTPTFRTINVSGSNITVDIAYTGTSCITTSQTASSGNKGG
jgi:PQQ-like domain